MLRKLIAINRGKTSAVLSNAEWLQILADCATIEAKVAKPIASFAEYALRGIYPQAQSPVNQNKKINCVESLEGKKNSKEFKSLKTDLFRKKRFHIFTKINCPCAKMGGYITIPDP